MFGTSMEMFLSGSRGMAGVAALVVLGSPLMAAAQTPAVYVACYVPLTGTVYRIKETNLKPACASTSHIEFNWIDGAGAIRISDPAGGDLTGVLSNATVVKLLGRALSNRVPVVGQVLGWNGHEWVAMTQLAGPPGPTGPTGPQGLTGDAGPPGPQGATGQNGVAGAQGLPGLDGATGPHGKPGLPGADGAPGAQGRPGADGAQGPPGPTGPAGPPGLIGPPGLPGATGATGAPGPEGPVGATGQPGNDGATGPQGQVGATGPAGQAGPTGPAGPAAATGWQRVTVSAVIPANTTQQVDLACPPGKVITGRGWILGTNSEMSIDSNVDSRTWRFHVRNLNPFASGTVDLYAVCLNGN